MNIFIDVVGCTANQSDSCIARSLLHRSSEYEVVESVEQANGILLFTCTVIASTEQRMLSRIKEYQKKGKQVIITGCMASIQPHLINSIDPHLKMIPPDKIHHLLSYLSSKEPRIKEEKYQMTKQYPTMIAPIAISEGCDFCCSYCITTHARGRLTSFPPSSIKKDVVSALEQGCKELQLTAQDTASYGMDRGSTLADLLNDLTSIPGVYRYRIGMMNPATVIPILDPLINAFDDEHIYQFLHLPIQSGDDELLEVMGRSYTVADINHIISTFRSQIPTITIATDVITGFPGETHSQHQHTMDLLTKIHPDITNITKFSARPHTKAKKMSHRIPTDVVKKRSTALTHLVSRLSYEKNKIHVGNTYPVLITEPGKNDTMVGRTPQYKPVVLAESPSIGEIVTVEITEAHQTYLFGMLK